MFPGNVTIMMLSTFYLIILLFCLKCVKSLSHQLNVTSAAECRLKCHSGQYKCQYASFNRDTGTCFISDTYSRSKSCDDVRSRHAGSPPSGVYAIDLGRKAGGMKDMYCQFVDGEAWTVALRRVSGSLSFTRNWKDYRTGFGNPKANVWIGLDALHTLTTARPHKALFILEMPGASGNASYHTISVSSETDHFGLTISGYSGNVGDAMFQANGMAFSTFDADNDMSSKNCASVKRGGWWFHDCLNAYLTGVYYPGPYSLSDVSCISNCAIQWNTFFSNKYNGLSFAEMLIAAK